MDGERTDGIDGLAADGMVTVLRVIAAAVGGAYVGLGGGRRDIGCPRWRRWPTARLRAPGVNLAAWQDAGPRGPAAYRCCGLTGRRWGKVQLWRRIGGPGGHVNVECRAGFWQVILHPDRWRLRVRLGEWPGGRADLRVFRFWTWGPVEVRRYGGERCRVAGR